MSRVHINWYIILHLITWPSSYNKCPSQKLKDRQDNSPCILYRRRSLSSRGINRWPVISPHKGPVTRKMFPFDDVIMQIQYISQPIHLGKAVPPVTSRGSHDYATDTKGIPSKSNSINLLLSHIFSAWSKVFVSHIRFFFKRLKAVVEVTLRVYKKIDYLIKLLEGWRWVYISANLVIIGSDDEFSLTESLPV